MTVITIILSFQMKGINAANTTSSLISQTKEENSIENFNKVRLLKQIDHNLWKFVPPVLYVVGTIGNMLTVAVLRR